MIKHSNRYCDTVGKRVTYMPRYGIRLQKRDGKTVKNMLLDSKTVAN